MLNRLKPSGVIQALSAIAFVFCAASAHAGAEALTFPKGTATAPEECGECHRAIYREYMFGVGSDAHDPHSSPKPAAAPGVPADTSSSGTAHAMSGSPIASISAEQTPSCNACHSPKPFDIAASEMAGKAPPHAGNAAKGNLTCAGCHLTNDGKIRAVHEVNAPHRTVVDPALQSSNLCAQCHGFYKTAQRIVGKDGQAFFEWQQDYFQPGLGKQQCQDCHMPRTLRKTAEDFEVPPRAVARHLWTGSCSRQRHLGALSLNIVREQLGSRKLSFHVSNVGAGHSVPTGLPQRAVYLRVEVLDSKGKRVGGKEWMFAPFPGDRPDDKAFLEEDRKLGAAGAALARADAQGPHESTIRAGEDRVLDWEPPLAPGKYTVNARLSYTLDRFAERPAADSASVLATESLAVSIP